MEDAKEITIKLAWDRENTALFTSRLLTLVNKEDIKFDLQVRKGSIIATFVIGVAGGIVSTALIELLLMYLEKRRRQARKKAKSLSIPNIQIDGKKADYEKLIKENIRDIVEKTITEVRRERIPLIKGRPIDEFIKTATVQELKEFSEKIKTEIENRHED